MLSWFSVDISKSSCLVLQVKLQAWWLARPGFDLDNALGDPCEALATAEGGLRFAGELAVVGLPPFPCASPPKSSPRELGEEKHGETVWEQWYLAKCQQVNYWMRWAVVVVYKFHNYVLIFITFQGRYLLWLIFLSRVAQPHVAGVGAPRNLDIFVNFRSPGFVFNIPVRRSWSGEKVGPWSCYYDCY